MKRYVFAEASDYPFLVHMNDDDSEFHEQFDEAFLDLSKRMADAVAVDPRLEMYLHGVFTNAEAEAILKVVGYMTNPFMMVLEVPKEKHHLFKVEEDIDATWYTDGYYFLDEDEYRTQSFHPFKGETIDASKRHLYFGAYMDKFYKVEARAVTNSVVKNRLDTIDS